MKTQYLFNNLLKNSKIYVTKYINLLFRLTFIFERLIDKFTVSESLSRVFITLWYLKKGFFG